MNGDSFLNVDISKFLAFKKNRDYYAKMILIKNNNYKSNKKLSSLSLGKNNLVNFNSKSKFMNSGIYYFKRKL